LVSKSSNLDAIKIKLKQSKVFEHKLITMQQGSKQSRFVAWTFLTPAQQMAWAKLRWR
jgi:23S rRNA (adenine1618-N6)-methyltransferase